MLREKVLVAVIALSGISVVSGQTSSAWNAAWESAASASRFVPSALAREIVQEELGSKQGESEDEYARRIFKAALDVELSLRFGTTGQEARARLRRLIRLQTAFGGESGERMSGKLTRVERKNKESARTSTGFAAAGSGKGKKGQ